MRRVSFTPVIPDIVCAHTHTYERRTRAHTSTHVRAVRALACKFAVAVLNALKRIIYSCNISLHCVPHLCIRIEGFSGSRMIVVMFIKTVVHKTLCS